MKLSLCMIVKNEEEVLERALSCARIFCDEIIVVDTGSSDDTIAIAKAFTDKVYSAPFRDFSSARNFSLSKATGDYIIWLDADDVVTPQNAQKFNSLKQRLCDEDFVMCPYVTAFDEADRPVFSYYRERIFKNRKGYRFEGKVHEAICPQGKIIFENIAVEHRKTKPSSPMRNLLIYQQSLCEGSILSTRDLYYYANELYQNNMPAQALAVYSEYRKRKDTFLPDLIQSFVNSSNILLDKNRCDEALSEILRALAYTRPTPTVLCQIGYVLQKQKKYGLSNYYYLAALTAEESSLFSFVNSDMSGYIPYVQLGYNNYMLGDIDKALFYNSKALALKPYGKTALDNNVFYLNEKIYCKTFSPDE